VKTVDDVIVMTQKEHNRLLEKLGIDQVDVYKGKPIRVEDDPNESILDSLSAVIYKDGLTMKELKLRCKAYDMLHGKYPESEYEGLSIWKWLTSSSAEVPYKPDVDEAWSLSGKDGAE